jgi:UDP-glucose 4-epimerase
MKILITGATGFLGRHLVRELLIDKHQIIVLGRSESKLKSVFGNSVSVFETDYSFESILKLSEDVDIIIHLAAKLLSRDSNPLKISDFFTNINCLENILTAAIENKVKKIIQISSISVYNNSVDNVTETMNLIPSNIYGVSKIFNDLYANYVNENSNLQILNLRIARLFGYGEREGLVFSNYIKQAKQKSTLEIHGDGSSTIEYIYVIDVVEAIKKCIVSNNCGTFNIGSGRLFSIKNIAEIINQIFNNEGNISFVQSEKKPVTGSLMNSDKAKHILGWESTWNLDTALKDILKYESNEKTL